MKYLIIHIDQIPEELDCSDLTSVGISDKEFETLAVKHGKVIGSCEEFESQFNSEMVSTTNDQIRIVL